VAAVGSAVTVVRGFLCRHAISVAFVALAAVAALVVEWAYA